MANPTETELHIQVQTHLLFVQNEAPEVYQRIKEMGINTYTTAFEKELKALKNKYKQPSLTSSALSAYFQEANKFIFHLPSP